VYGSGPPDVDRELLLPVMIGAALCLVTWFIVVENCSVYGSEGQFDTERLSDIWT